MSVPLDFVRSHFDHTDPALTGRRMYEAYDRLRETCPITRSDAHGGFLVLSRHPDVVAAALDHSKLLSGHGSTIPHHGIPVPAIPTETDGPAHRSYRDTVWRFLTPAIVKGYEPAVRAIVTRLIDGFIEEGRVDLVPALTHPFPVKVAAMVFGFDGDSAVRFDRWFRALLEATNMNDLAAQGEAAGSFIAFLREMVHETDPANCGGLLHAAITGTHHDGTPYSEDERVGLLWTTAAAAVETSSHALEHAFELLDQNRIIRERLISDPGLLPGAVEEVLRLSCPVQMIARTAGQDVELGSHTLSPGERVLLLLGSANRDPAIFGEPDTMQIDRHPNRHLTFGWGVHKCVGQHLARLEVRVAIEEVLRRLPDYEIADQVPPSRLRGGIFWGLDSLPIRFTPG